MYIRMTLSIKFEAICVFMMAIEKFSQLNYSQKTWNIVGSCCYKPSDGNSKNQCDHPQEILTNATMEKNFTLLQEILT